MDETRLPPWGEELDRAAFERVWRRVMPQDRPDCPFTLDPPAPAASGPEEAQPPARKESDPLVPQGAADILQRMAEGRMAYRALERRWGLRALGDLEREKNRQVRELSAALFLLTGKEFRKAANPAAARVPLVRALRERYQEELSLADALRRAGGAAGDPLLEELLPALALRCEVQARQIWALLARR